LRRKLLLLSMVVLVLLSSGLVVLVKAANSTWNQTYGGIEDEQAFVLVETSDGGYAIAGYTTSFGAGARDFWLVKTNEYGFVEWNKTYGGPEYETAYSLIQTSDDGYILAGGALVVKTDAYGVVEWNKTYGSGINSLIQASDGGYAIAAYTSTFGAGNLDCRLIKIDEFGDIEWDKAYGGTSDDRAYSVVETSDGGYVMAGYTNSFGVGSYAFWLIKTDELGIMQWNKTYQRTPPEATFAVIEHFTVVEATDGGYTIAGNSGPAFSSDVCLIKTDAYGVMEWNQTYGGLDIDWTTSLITTSDGGYVIAGNTNSSGSGDHDFWLFKTDAYGNMEWKKTYGGTGCDRALNVIETSDGKYAIAGFTASFGAGSQDFWLVKTSGCVDTNEFDTYEFDFSFGYNLYTVVVSTNSTLGGFDFGVNQNQISFSVTGPTGTTGFCQITIPEDLAEGDFPVYLNGEALMDGVDYTRTYNGTHTIFDITYSHSFHRIEITGTTLVPEYSSWLLPSLLLVATLVIVIYKKKRFT